MRHILQLTHEDSNAVDSGDGSVQQWNADGGPSPIPQATLETLISLGSAVPRWSAASTLASSESDELCRAIDSESGCRCC
eukprot:SAG11_NODE_571_length_8451_cov_34.938218_9_plen_80_part_00